MVFSGAVVASAPVVAAPASAEAPTEEQHRLVRILRAWHRRVTTPAMIVVWALGIALAFSGSWFSSSWLQVKLALVIVLSGLHGVQSGALRRLEGGLPGRSQGPVSPGLLAAALTLGTAVLAVVKPF